MEKFYFCNFLGESLSRRCNKGVTSVEVSTELTEQVQVAKSYLCGEGSELCLRFVCEDEKCEGTEFDFIGTFNAEDKRVKSTVEELGYTDENPIIIVATKEFKVYNGIPTYIKYIPVEDGVLVALIKGYISVMDSNGEMIPLSRNCAGLSLDIGTVFKADDIRKLNSLTDKESDIPYSDYVVNDCIILLETTKDNRNITNLKFSRNHFSVMYDGAFEEGRAKKEANRLKKEEAMRKKAEDRLRYAEIQKEEMKRMEEQKKAEKAKKAPKKKENVQTGFEGAQSFLAFVEGLKKGQ